MDDIKTDFKEDELDQKKLNLVDAETAKKLRKKKNLIKPIEDPLDAKVDKKSKDAKGTA